VAPDWSVGKVGLAVNGGLTLISLLSLVIRRPFTLQYAEEQIPEQYWNTPLFIRTNQLDSPLSPLQDGVAAVAGSNSRSRWPHALR
jgi:hypothetical protein